MTPMVRRESPWSERFCYFIPLLTQRSSSHDCLTRPLLTHCLPHKVLATAMSLIASAWSVPKSRRSGLLLLGLSVSTFASTASARSTRLPVQRNPFSPAVCSINKDICVNIAGARLFHSAPLCWKNTPQFSYQVAAAYAAKGDRFNAKSNVYTNELFENIENRLSLRECKQSKKKRDRAKSGQDAFFYSQIGTTGATAFGVADGVGGWMDSGLDPADFSHGLCEYMSCNARAWPQGSKGSSLHPKDLLQTGYDEVISDDSIIGGGSTACIAVAEPNGSVEVANLGDSGFMHLGLNAVRHFTQPQTHAFNTPFQLSKTPHRMLVQMAVFGGPSTLSDLPKESDISHHQVRHGDILVFATDGVWDNLSPQDALSIVSRNMVELGAWKENNGVMEVGETLTQLTQARTGQRADRSSLQARLAIAIAKEAKDTGLDTRRDGPFAREVQKYYPGENWHGGKPDDIAVVIAVVIEDS
ncbi:protein serine/threonine phosphatase 2C [Aaosphaeria arxii CBS 175.79]|uniref:Protein phosphatase n=1 Tax=Aaosphaeria arxii CBS 175.79 TaxID=1450172 RepID=A0A6A5XJ12_9PLEO|nr:protein serine/threonine phosphatase 2C [Aaosphaeria arxii CBS 175.79]KAF2013258.1 protein serine/threonine phosphatase 2C [Aaosphaeria arxii CBS 175.79]